MAGVGTVSVNQTPQYGDKSKLRELGKTTTTTPMTGNLTEAPAAGRPVTTGAGLQQQAPQPAPQADTGAVSPEHKSMMSDLAQAYRTNQFWQNVLSQYPSEWSKVYAKEAERNFQRKQVEVRQATPYFE
jgi:hypothetical protein